MKSKDKSIGPGVQVELLEIFETGDHQHRYEAGAMGIVQTVDGTTAWVLMGSDGFKIAVYMSKIRQVHVLV